MRHPLLEVIHSYPDGLRNVWYLSPIPVLQILEYEFSTCWWHLRQRVKRLGAEVLHPTQTAALSTVHLADQRTSLSFGIGAARVQSMAPVTCRI